MTLWKLWACLGLAAGTAVGACGADDDQGSEVTDGTTATGGAVSTGGRATSNREDGEEGVSAGTGGKTQADEGDARDSSGGASEKEEETGGADSLDPATGGSGPRASLAERALSACQNEQSIGYVFGCMAVYEDTYVSECVDAWGDAAEKCPSEAEALLDCGAMREAMDYDCDSERRVTLVDGVCEPETEALDTCLGG